MKPPSQKWLEDYNAHDEPGCRDLRDDQKRDYFDDGEISDKAVDEEDVVCLPTVNYGHSRDVDQGPETGYEVLMRSQQIEPVVEIGVGAPPTPLTEVV